MTVLRSGILIALGGLVFRLIDIKDDTLEEVGNGSYCRLLKGTTVRDEE